MNSRKYDVIASGMLCCDIPLFPVSDRLFKMEFCRIPSYNIMTGGDALDVATTVAILGGRAATCGYVGHDMAGQHIIEYSRKKNVDVSMIRVVEDGESSATSYHIIEPDGERHTILVNAIYAKMSSEIVNDENLRDTKVIYFGSALAFEQMDNGGIQELFSRAHKFDTVTALDTSLDVDYASGPNTFNILKPALGETDIFLPSLREISFLLGGEQDPHKIAQEMRQFKNMKIFGVKMGADGCYLTDFNTELYIDAFKGFRVVDVTGAGDSFVGSFLRAYLLGFSLEKCGVFASVVAAHNVAVLGATGGVPTFEAAMDYMNNHKTKIKSHLF